MIEQSFLIIHGLGGSGSDHWQTWLAKELTKRNYHVCYPTFSRFNAPNKKVWLEELHEAIKTLPAKHQLTVITHSLGCFLWLHYAAGQRNRIANQVILVAPPSPNVILSEAKTFYPVPLKKSNLSGAAKETLFIHSTNDPYCSMVDTTGYLNLGFPSIVLPNSGHINIDSGHGKWPRILDLSLGSDKVVYSI
ncbi:alpha/beta fold hydrolase [Neobacillus sp. MM2021_6]|uniref:RBBP9/YdeN family alpha/beta hydrolase n=1 Tax=Bacillaceae TaxID=186817 RepID=UPI00140B1977|nr:MULTISPECIES: alpha/beta fold hydrolase [Bacillaceae]MBO0962464.1 alpha/beta fold hydrolase [Neobacillus sp. MM2021_6]NHC18979.1 alpha/beta fold hydrolase [Bacillus sp. MM2020_4]